MKQGEHSKQRVLIVSNTLPIRITKRKGVLNYSPSPGGLATGLSPIYQSHDNLWIGWPGITPSEGSEREGIIKELRTNNLYPVFLSQSDVEKYYEGFCNKTIWPLFHYFTQYAVYDPGNWATYERVNNRFCEAVLKTAKPGDTIWVHDYHLFLLPRLIRERLPDVSIGFFLHIPFPSFEIFRLLPWREAVLEGLLGSNLIGFHTYDYVRHFLSAVQRLLGFEHTWGKLTLEDRIIKIDSFPLGIDYEKYSKASTEAPTKKEITRNLKKIGNRKIVLSIDRMDYTKGIPQRLESFHRFLEQHPEFREKVTLILVAVPSRSRVETYRQLKHQIDELVGRINGEHGTIGWMPVWYLYRSFPFTGLSALYSISDVALVTPFRDGMNLIAKEFIANRQDGTGVLILSEVAGAANELGEAIIINPNNTEEIAEAIHQALTMPEEEQIRRNRAMQEKLRRYDVTRWAEDFMEKLHHTKELQRGILTKHLNPASKQELITSYTAGHRRLIFLDYDGTLIPFALTPKEAVPDENVLDLLRTLGSVTGNDVVLISGRDRETIDVWFGDLPIHLVAEHGAWIREKDGEWKTIESLSQDWKEEIRPILESYVDRTPGSFIEPKEFSLVWHYRQADPGQAQLRARELMETLVYLTGNLDLQILEGSKVIEVKNAGITKGKAASRWLAGEHWDFIMAIGDDWTDEDLFKAMPKGAYTIKVGFTTSEAKHKVKSPHEVKLLLHHLIEGKTDEAIE
jgi:trehalose 6-phosphate synthase/phosphatase